MSNAILLIHGGLYEGKAARKFWIDTGVGEALTRLGFKIYAPDRVKTPSSWEKEASHLAEEIGSNRQAPILAASNGCSAAARLAVATPERVRSIQFCWPATAGNPQVDAITRRNLLEAGCSPEAAEILLSGEILRGVTAGELADLAIPVGIIAPDPPDLFHQRETIDLLISNVPNAIELGAFPHPFAPGFRESLPDFCEAIRRFIEGTTNFDAQQRWNGDERMKS